MVPATTFCPKVKKQNTAPSTPQASPSRREGLAHRPRTTQTKQTPQNKQKKGGDHTWQAQSRNRAQNSPLTTPAAGTIRRWRLTKASA